MERTDELIKCAQVFDPSITSEKGSNGHVASAFQNLVQKVSSLMDGNGSMNDFHSQ